MTALKKYFGLILFVLVACSAIVAFAGAPLKGVDVKLGKNPGGSPAGRATTDHEGKFTFSNLEPGTYDLYLSYADCAKHAINTKGTGVAGRSGLDAGSKDAAKFEIEMLPSEGVSFAYWPHMHQTATHAKATASPQSQVLRVALTSESSDKEPLATITVSGSHRLVRGHVTLLR